MPCSQTTSMAYHLWIHEKAPCTEVRNWLWVIMHKHQKPWHFLFCQTIIFLSVYLQLMIEFQSPKNPISALCMYPQYTQLLRVHTAACTAKLISSLYMGGLWKQSWLFPSFSKAPLCALGLEAFCGDCTCTFTGCRRKRERQREGVLLLNNPPPITQ